MEKMSSTEVGQTTMITGDPKITRRSTHPQPYLTKSEVRLRVPQLRPHSRQMASSWHFAYCEYAGFKVKAFAEGKSDISDELVFPSEAGTPIEMNNFSERVFKPLVTRAGLRRIRFHDLRHYAPSRTMPHHHAAAAFCRALALNHKA